MSGLPKDQQLRAGVEEGHYLVLGKPEAGGPYGYWKVRCLTCQGVSYRPRNRMKRRCRTCYMEDLSMAAKDQGLGICTFCNGTAITTKGGLRSVCAACRRRAERNGCCPCGQPAYASKPCPFCGRCPRGEAP